MKRTYTIFLSLVLISFSCAYAHASVTMESTPSSGLQAYWTFDGKTINWNLDTAADSSGNGNTGTLVNMTSSVNSVKGKIGQALLFDGNVTSVDIASNPIPAVSSPTSVCLWANTSDITSFSGGWSESFLNFFTNSNNALRMGSVVSTGNLFISYRFGGAAHGAQTTAAVFTNNVWNHVCYVWDGGGMTLYANGVSMATTTNSDSPGIVNVIGARDDAGDGVWDGALDDVRLYNRALSAAEVKRIYQGGIATLDKVSGGKAKQDVGPANFLTSGLVGYWSMDGKKINWAAGTVTDDSGQGNTGTLMGMSTSTSPVQGKIGQALSFNGVSTQVDVPNSSSLVFSRTAPFSISAWIKVATTTIPGGCWDSIAGKGNSSTGVGLYFAVTLAASNACEGIVANANSVVLDLLGSSAQFLLVDSPLNSIPIGSWAHVVCTYNGNSDASGAQLYINGILQSKSVLKNTLTSLSISNTNNFGIGDDNTNDYMNGAEDDIRVYNRVLSQSEITQLYNEGK